MRDAACATRMAEDRAQAAAVAVSVSGPRALRDGPACVKIGLGAILAGAAAAAHLQ